LEKKPRKWVLTVKSSTDVEYELKEIPDHETLKLCLDASKIEGPLKELGL